MYSLNHEKQLYNQSIKSLSQRCSLINPIFLSIFNRFLIAFPNTIIPGYSNIALVLKFILLIFINFINIF